MRNADLTWGQWLTQRMTELGFTSNKALERATGIDNTVISRWRSDETVPSVEHLRRLTGPLQAALVELLVRAGHLTAAEAKLTVLPAPEPPPLAHPDPATRARNLGAASVDELLDELRRRAQAAGEQDGSA